MDLTAENLKVVFIDCLFRDDEDMTNYVEAHGVTLLVGFHPGRLASHEQDIRDMLNCLPADFHKDSGDSFLNACVTYEGVQWGDHQALDQLLTLGLASKQVHYTLAMRKMWQALPGGVPVFRVGAPRNMEVLPKQETMQEICDRFNVEYAKACETGQPYDLRTASHTGRQLVQRLYESGIIEDNFEL
jgi:hypothetical protein